MKSKYLLLFVIFTFVPSCAAQVSGDWNISGDWGASPYPTPQTSATINSINVINNCYIAIGLISTVLILSGVSIMFLSYKSDGENGNGGALAGIVFLLAGFTSLVVGLAIVNGFAATVT